MNRQEELERIGRERLAAEREAERARRRRFLRVLVELAASGIVGVTVMGTAFAVTDREIGEMLLSTGMIVAYSGITYSLARAYLRAEEHGDI